MIHGLMMGLLSSITTTSPACAIGMSTSDVLVWNAYASSITTASSPHLIGRLHESAGDPEHLTLDEDLDV